MAEVIRVVPATQPTPPPQSITLKLTGREAAALEVVLSHVGGSPELSSRGQTANVLTVLRAAGFRHPLNGDGVSGNMSFKDGS